MDMDMEPAIFYPWTAISQSTPPYHHSSFSTSPRSTPPSFTSQANGYAAAYRLNSLPSDFDFSQRRESLWSDEGSDAALYQSVVTDDAFLKPPEVKRARGRPRKNPIIIPDPHAKPAKSRSKTGCYTCRRRKKKCDEAKPTCQNCAKNNVECSGYPTPAHYPSSSSTGTQSANAQNGQEAKKTSVSSTCTSTDSISPRLSVDTDIDTSLLRHFCANLSRTLSLAQGPQNPYLRFIYTMASQRQALMHALLGLSGSHLSMQSSNPEVSARSCYHLDFAIADLRIISQQYASTHAHVEDAAIAQALVIFLKIVIAPEERGKYCKLLDFVRHLVIYQGASNESFQAFLVDFIITYDVSNAVVSLGYRPSLQPEVVQRAQELTTPSGAFLGVLDSFCIPLARITKIRDSIRACRSQGIPVKGDPLILTIAASIDADLHAWQSGQPAGSDEHTLSLLYRQCTWIYLYRTLLPSAPDPRLRDAVTGGIAALASLRPDSVAQSMLLMPLYLLGCGAFERSQRPAIDHAFGNLAIYRKCDNVAHARGVVHKLWEMMDSGDERSWDWETFTSHEGLDWLVV